MRKGLLFGFFWLCLVSCVSGIVVNDCVGVLTSSCSLIVDVSECNSAFEVSGGVPYQCYWDGDVSVCYAERYYCATTTTTRPVESTTTTTLASATTTTLYGGGVDGGEEVWIFPDDDGGDDGGLDCCFGLPIVGGVLGGLMALGGSMLGGSIQFCDPSLNGLLLAFICLSLVSFVYLRYVLKLRVKVEKFILRLEFIVSTVCLWLAVVLFICYASLNLLVILALIVIGVKALNHKFKVLKDEHSAVIFGLAGVLLSYLLKLM